jgi:hypothetical protein
MGSHGQVGQLCQLQLSASGCVCLQVLSGPHTGEAAIFSGDWAGREAVCPYLNVFFYRWATRSCKWQQGNKVASVNRFHFHPWKPKAMMIGSMVAAGRGSLTCPALQLSGWRVGPARCGAHMSVEESQGHGRVGTSEDPCPVAAVPEFLVLLLFQISRDTTGAWRAFCWWSLGSATAIHKSTDLRIIQRIWLEIF